MTEKTFIKGYTLVEMMIVLSIFVLIASMSVVFLTTSLSGSSKSEITGKVKENGEYVLSVIEGLVLNGKSLKCEGGRLEITDPYGGVATISCEGGKVSSASSLLGDTPTSVILTSEEVEVVCDSGTFVCNSKEGLPDWVDIKFKVRPTNFDNLRPSEKTEIEFQSRAATRNY